MTGTGGDGEGPRIEPGALRAPLGVAASHAAALEDGTLGPLAPRQQAAVRRIQGAVLRANLLVADMTALTGIGGAPVTDATPLDYDDVVARMLDFFGPLAEGREVTLDSRSELQSRVALDLDCVSHVLTSIVYDAIQLTPRGGTVTVRVGQRGDRLVTEVDAGCPALPAPDRARLLGAFGEVDLPAARAAGGVVIGLGVGRRRVEALGGELGAGEGPGATLWFSVPVLRA